jgi:hypothetical protein
MAAALTSQSFPPASAAITYTTSASGTPLTQTGNTAPTGAGLALLVKNASGSGITVNMTIPAGITLDGIAQTTPLAINVANGADQVIPLRPQRYADPVTGLATFGFASAPASTISVACINTN